MTLRRGLSVLLALCLLCLCGASAYATEDEDEDGGIASLLTVGGAIEGTAVVRTVTAQKDIAVTVDAANGSEAERDNLSVLPPEKIRATLGSFSVAVKTGEAPPVFVELSIPTECVGGYLDLLHDAAVERSLRIDGGAMRVSVTGTGVYTLAVSETRLAQRVSPVTGQDALPFLLGALALLSAVGALLAGRKIKFT